MRGLTLLFTVLLSSWGTPALASCVYLGPLCATWKSYDAIFDGTVRSIQRVDRDEELGDKVQRVGHRIVTFDVHESWRGTVGRHIDLFLWGGSWPDGGVITSGGFDVALGERYLIFANVNARGELTTSSCAGSSRYADASGSLAFLRSLKSGAFRPRIQGRLSLPYSPFHETIERKEVDATLRLTSETGTRLLQLKTGGAFEFADLSLGTYTLSVTGPPDLVAVPSTLPVTLDDPELCREVLVSLRHDTSISGVVVDRASRPLDSVRIEVAPAATWKEKPLSTIADYTDATGRFELVGIPPGDYVVGVNLRDDVRYEAREQALYTSSAGGAETIAVASGQHVWLGQWTLPPPLPQLKMRLRVVDPDGQPVRRADLTLIDLTNPDTPEIFRTVYGDGTDDLGIVEFDGRSSRVYAIELSSHRSDIRMPRSRPFAAEAATNELTIVLPRR